MIAATYMIHRDLPPADWYYKIWASPLNEICQRINSNQNIRIPLRFYPNQIKNFIRLYYRCFFTLKWNTLQINSYKQIGVNDTIKNFPQKTHLYFSLQSNWNAM